MHLELIFSVICFSPCGDLIGHHFSALSYQIFTYVLGLLSLASLSFYFSTHAPVPSLNCCDAVRNLDVWWRQFTILFFFQTPLVILCLLCFHLTFKFVQCHEAMERAGPKLQASERARLCSDCCYCPENQRNARLIQTSRQPCEVVTNHCDPVVAEGTGDWWE